MTKYASPGVGLTLALGSMLIMALSDAQAQEPPPAFSMRTTPQPLAEIQFENGQGEAMSLADFKGSVVLLNIWATWCAPCRREMPTLDRLQATLGGPDFQVVALSIDRQGLPVVQEFYDELGLETLPISSTRAEGRSARSGSWASQPRSWSIARATRSAVFWVRPNGTAPRWWCSFATT